MGSDLVCVLLGQHFPFCALEKEVRREAVFFPPGRAVEAVLYPAMDRHSL